MSRFYEVLKHPFKQFYTCQACSRSVSMEDEVRTNSVKGGITG